MHDDALVQRRRKKIQSAIEAAVLFDQEAVKRMWAVLHDLGWLKTCKLSFLGTLCLFSPFLQCVVEVL